MHQLLSDMQYTRLRSTETPGRARWPPEMPSELGAGTYRTEVSTFLEPAGALDRPVVAVVGDDGDDFAVAHVDARRLFRRSQTPARAFDRRMFVQERDDLIKLAGIGSRPDQCRD
jgi:hypothetical protein